MHTRIVGIADLRRTQVGTRHQAVNERRLTHTTITTEQRYLTIQHRVQLFNALARLCRYLTTLIANRLVQIHHSLLIAQRILIQQVRLVEYQHHRYTISLSRSQETVNKGCRGLRVSHGHYQESLVHISRNDMTLLRQVDTLADNIVTTILDVHNPSFLIHLYPVAHSHRIGRTDTLQAEVTLHLTIKQLAIVRSNGVPTACIFNDESFQL